MIKIAPSILSADFLRLGEEISAAEKAGADIIHIDVMDGHFVPNITIGPLIVAAARRCTRLPLDVHLMISDPGRYIDDFVRAGADYLTVHAEAAVHLHRTVQSIRERGVRPGVSLNPATPVCAVEQVITDVDLVLIMSVNPGFGGQRFIPQATAKIRAVREMIASSGSSALIEVDGGVKTDNARLIADAGADILVMGSAFFESGDYAKTMETLRAAFGSR
ncbi:MAG: ribulose-phosphate 3-epimerase [Thermodesulfovibrionales bacterium]